MPSRRFVPFLFCLSLVGDAAMKSAPEFKTSKALRRFIEANLKDKDLFEPGFVLKRP